MLQITTAKNKVEEDGGQVFENKSVIAITGFDCLIPNFIVKLMNDLNDQFNDVEYSILGKAEYDKENRRLIVSDEWYIPEQSVSSTVVEYEEHIPEYNLVIHKHPDNCKSFSTTDELYINNNFPYSLLWVNRKFETGIANVFCEELGCRIRLNLYPKVFGKVPDYLEQGVKKIKRISYKTNYYGGVGNHYSKSGGFKKYKPKTYISSRDYSFGDLEYSEDDWGDDFGKFLRSAAIDDNNREIDGEEFMNLTRLEVEHEMKKRKAAKGYAKKYEPERNKVPAFPKDFDPNGLVEEV